MNLVAKEFISSRKNENGVLVLSKFTGASRELKDALLVNPYYFEEMSEAIYNALMMNGTEIKKKNKKIKRNCATE